MHAPASCSTNRLPYQSRLIARLAEVLAATDRFVGWWGAHRAWPAGTPEWKDRPR